MKKIIANLKKLLFLFSVSAFFVLATGVNPVLAQLEEPEVISDISPRTPLDEGYNNRWGIDLLVNNFGFGLAGTYGKMLGPYTELTFKTGITGLREASEQNFQDFFTGQQITPNKYNRAFAFPFMLGIKKRLFANQISDNMRFFVSSSAGPAMAFVFPYLRDINEPNGYRDYQLTQQGFLVPREGFNDFFSGWSDGSSEWGVAGELKLGVDLGENFGTQTTVEFGYFFYYFDQGIQILQPRRAVYNRDGEVVEVFDFNPPSKYFGTPQISVIFGGMW